MRPRFTSLGEYETRGYLRVFAVRLDRTRDDAGMAELARSEVEIDGKVWQCRGVERFMHMGPWSQGEMVGLGVVPVRR